MEDFEQEVYMFIIPRLKNFDIEKSSLKTYIPLKVMSRAKQLIQLANGQCKDKSINKLEFTNSILSLDFETEGKDSSSSFENAIADNEFNLEVRLIINEILHMDSLTDKQRTIILLMSQGLSVSDIARKLNKSASCINITFQRAKEKIVKKYEGMI
jgi:RNA polymerase sigma factor (sigma-70 family)